MSCDHPKWCRWVRKWFYRTNGPPTQYYILVSVNPKIVEEIGKRAIIPSLYHKSIISCTCRGKKNIIFNNSRSIIQPTSAMSSLAMRRHFAILPQPQRWRRTLPEWSHHPFIAGKAKPYLNKESFSCIKSPANLSTRSPTMSTDRYRLVVAAWLRSHGYGASQMPCVSNYIFKDNQDVVHHQHVNHVVHIVSVV